MRIALIGSRGIPAAYGGYETLFEELAPRLVDRGHEVTVYCRPRYTPKQLREYRGVDLVVLPTIATKHLDTPVHTALSALHGSLRRFDVALVVNGANAVFVPILRAARIPTALHVDGIERQRKKWGRLGRSVYALSERLACHVPNRLVTDARVIEQHYLVRYKAASRLIRYGVDASPLPPGATLEGLGLERRRYFLYVSRFEPENNPHRVVEAYADVQGRLPLVMVGDAPYAKTFIESVRRSADSRVLFPGAIYGDGYRELLSNALAYIHATEVGGTHPALVEAMGYGNCVIVNETPENVEVAGSNALYFQADRPTTLGASLESIRLDPAFAAAMGEKARAHAQCEYSWERVCDEYESLFDELARGRRTP